MSKKVTSPTKVTKVTKPSLSERYEDLRDAAREYISRLRNPRTTDAFYLTTYNVDEKTGARKPNALSAPEIAAIVGTAQKLGRQVQITIKGQGDDTRLSFYFVEVPGPVPDIILD